MLMSWYEGHTVPSLALRDEIVVQLRAYARQQVEAWRDGAVGLVDEWSQQYPEEIFIPPPAGEHGVTVDACSARALRVVLPAVAKALRDRPVETP